MEFRLGCRGTAGHVQLHHEIMQYFYHNQRPPMFIVRRSTVTDRTTRTYDKATGAGVETTRAGIEGTHWHVMSGLNVSSQVRLKSESEFEF